MLIHALAESMAPIHDAFRADWPGAEIYDLLDSSLSADLAADGGVLSTRMVERFRTLGRYAVAQTDCDAILFTCSAFGPAIDAVKRDLSNISVLKPNEAAFERAMQTGSRIGLLVTFEPSLQSLVRELEAMAQKSGAQIKVEARMVPGAMAALRAGRASEHDGLITNAATELSKPDVLVLGQFSMARAAQVIRERVSFPVLTTPGSAVAKLRDGLGAGLPRTQAGAQRI